MSLVATYSVLVLVSLGHASIPENGMMLQLGRQTQSPTSTCADPDLKVPKYSALDCSDCQGCFAGGHCYTGQVSAEKCVSRGYQWCCKGCFRQGYSVAFDFLNEDERTQDERGKCNPECALNEDSCVQEGFTWDTDAVQGDDYYGATPLQDSDADEVTYAFRAQSTHVDVCRDSEGESMQDDWRLMEDCTLKDFYVWKNSTLVSPTFSYSEYGADEVWKSVQVLQEDGWKESSCVAYVKTEGSCKDWCDSHGLRCLMAMDDANHNHPDQETRLISWLDTAGAVATTSCTLNGPAHERKKVRNIGGYIASHGCNATLNDQICACASKTTMT